MPYYQLAQFSLYPFSTTPGSRPSISEAPNEHSRLYLTIRGEPVMFVSEDDLWSAPASGGVARRLISGVGAALVPALSPDRKWLAFSAHDEGPAEVYVMPAEGKATLEIHHADGSGKTTAAETRRWNRRLACFF